MEDSYRFKIGDFLCLAINDGDFVGNADMLFANAPEAELLRVLHNYGLEPDHLPSTWTCLLVKTPTNVVLVDTGFGAGGKYGGRLLPALRAEGFKPEDIDTVILTHAHADHIGGCVDGAGKPTFPEATYIMWQDEWDFWTTEATLNKVSDWAANVARQKLPPLAQQLKNIDSETEIVPGIRAIAAPGHTAGHIAVEIESNGEYLLDMVDVALHPIQIEYPEWTARLDQFPEQTVATRQAIYQRAAETNAMVLAFHFPPFPSLGHIVKQNTRWKWSPLPGLTK
jgi:glyoxylase-like metal-dependent hydrolase (beta-lactamase superfamily II)